MPKSLRLNTPIKHYGVKVDGGYVTAKLKISQTPALYISDKSAQKLLDRAKHLYDNLQLFEVTILVVVSKTHKAVKKTPRQLPKMAPYIHKVW